MAATKGTVLAVDDTPANLEIITETLGDAGYIVSTAIDGKRAINRAKSAQPDLILLDVMMPDIDGFETCRQLKSNPSTASIPIIFITALTDTASKIKGFSLGGVDYITKPFQEQEMLARVNTHLRIRQLNQNLEAQVTERTQELEMTLAQLHGFQLQLVQQEKMSVLGNLMAGVAHEINNPTAFLKGNIRPAQTYVQTLLELVDLLLQKCPNNDPDIQNELDHIDFDFIRQDLPKLLDSMTLGVDRIRSISHSLRIFARKDRDHKTEFDIHDGLNSTLLILNHRIKGNQNRPDIDIIKHYSQLPKIHCFPGQLNQVFMNLLANAIDALDEASQCKRLEERKANPNRITIKTEVIEEKWVQIQIQDNGCGMTAEVKERIFEQGFTTKEVGKGTGLGMAIARQIVVDTHGGALGVQSIMHQGTQFCIRLPLH